VILRDISVIYVGGDVGAFCSSSKASLLNVILMIQLLTKVIPPNIILFTQSSLTGRRHGVSASRRLAVACFLVFLMPMIDLTFKEIIRLHRLRR
jgi:hypothetical protein